MSMYKKLRQEIDEKDIIINNLIERNQELMETQMELTDPQRDLLVVTHNPDENAEWVKILAMLYQNAFNNRLAISDVRDSTGNVKKALCGIAPVGDGTKSFCLYPLFALEDVPHNETWEFPKEGGGWMQPGEETEADMKIG